MRKFFQISILLILTVGLQSCFLKKKQDANAVPTAKKYREVEKRAMYVEALSLEQTGRYEAALQVYDKCIAMDPSEGAAYYAKSNIYSAVGQFHQAIVDAEQAVKLDVKNTWYKVHLASLYFAFGDFQKAATVYTAVVKDWPKDEQFYYAQAECFIRLKKYNEAIVVYDEAQRQTGISEELFRRKYLLYMQIGKVDKANAELDQMMQLNPGNTGVLLLKADALYESGKQEQAFDTYNQVLVIEPDNGFALLGLARYFEMKGDEAAVLREMEKAFRSTTFDVDHKVRIMLDYFEQTMKENAFLGEAYKLINVLIETHPDEAKVHSVSGDFLARDGRTEEARNSFYRAVKLVPDNYVLWNEVLFLDAELAQYDSLFNHANEAATLFPAQAAFHYFKGLGAFQIKKYNQAIEAFVNARSMLVLPDQNELDAEILQFLGDAYHANGEKDKAYESYDKHLVYKPDNVFVLNNFAYYLALDKRDLDKAARMAMKVNKLKPDQGSYMDTYGWVLFQQGEYEDAAFWIKKAIDNNAKSAVILEHYGDVLYKLNRKQEAVLYWKEAKEKGTGKPSGKLDEKINSGTWVE